MWIFSRQIRFSCYELWQIRKGVDRNWNCLFHHSHWLNEFKNWILITIEEKNQNIHNLPISAYKGRTLVMCSPPWRFYECLWIKIRLCGRKSVLGNWLLRRGRECQISCSSIPDNPSISFKSKEANKIYPNNINYARNIPGRVS